MLSKYRLWISCVLLLLALGAGCRNGTPPGGDAGVDPRAYDLRTTGYRLTALYPRPVDPAAFDAHYRDVHVPLTLKVPGVEAFVYGNLVSLDPTQPSPYYFAATVYTQDAESFQQMLASPEAAAAMADVPNFATGGVFFVAGAETVFVPEGHLWENTRKLMVGHGTARYQRLVVVYGMPTDPAAFVRHYAKVHIPLTLAVPGLSLFTNGECLSLDSSPPVHYFAASIYASDADALNRALGTPEAQRAIADVPNYATGGATFMTGEATLILPHRR